MLTSQRTFLMGESVHGIPNCLYFSWTGSLLAKLPLACDPLSILLVTEGNGHENKMKDSRRSNSLQYWAEWSNRKDAQGEENYPRQMTRNYLRFKGLLD